MVVDKEGTVKERKTDKVTIIPFSDERDMLMKYLELYEMINPTIVTGWNIDYFDTPMLYNRIKRLLGERQAKIDYHQSDNVSGLLIVKDISWAGVSYLDYISAL